ncbi:hypothetical protein KM043_001913 [Ampulex compressa]|nr:hypothetical protein KM043_001913 [Ampulex compressa]
MSFPRLRYPHSANLRPIDDLDAAALVSPPTSKYHFCDCSGKKKCRWDGGLPFAPNFAPVLPDISPVGRAQGLIAKVVHSSLPINHERHDSRYWPTTRIRAVGAVRREEKVRSKI